MARPYAEDVNYWKTSKASADKWIIKAQQQIENLDGEAGKLYGHAFASDSNGQAAYLLEFGIGTDSYKMVWPILESKSGNTLAAQRQAATALYHEVKGACVRAKWIGVRAAFISYLRLASGWTVGTLSDVDLMQEIPKLLEGGEL